MNGFLNTKTVNITGELILEKARETMKILNPKETLEFNFSLGWLEKFKLDMVLSHFVVLGKVDQLIHKTWKTNWSP